MSVHTDNTTQTTPHTHHHTTDNTTHTSPQKSWYSHRFFNINIVFSAGAQDIFYYTMEFLGDIQAPPNLQNYLPPHAGDLISPDLPITNLMLALAVLQIVVANNGGLKELEHQLIYTTLFLPANTSFPRLRPYLKDKKSRVPEGSAKNLLIRLGVLKAASI